MAKWGEGDPRWLVEDRPDATNVNNWHWTEKNASRWSKDRLEELLVGAKVESEVGTCEITEMSKCEGDAAVNNRKAKLIFFYEWNITLKWKGSTKDGGVANGTLEVPNLSEEHEIQDVDVNVAVETKGSQSDVLKELMRGKGAEVIRQKLSIYLKSLKEEFSKGVILPTKENNTQSNTSKVTSDSHKIVNSDGQKKVQTVNNKSFLDTTEMKVSATFKCTADEFYRAMTTKEMVDAFTYGNCTVDAVKNGKFELFGGNVNGYFTDLVPNKLIKQKWRFKTWPDGHYSDVSIEIDQKEDCTEINVKQSGIPKSEMERTTEGWKKHYWESMKRTFGFGAVLF